MPKTNKMLLKQIGGEEDTNTETPIIVVEIGDSRFTITPSDEGGLAVTKMCFDDTKSNDIFTEQYNRDSVEIF